VAGDGAQIDSLDLLIQLRGWARELGFSQVGVADVDLSSAEARPAGLAGGRLSRQMDYMAAHGLKRARPAELVPGTVSVVTARMDYLPRATPGGLAGGRAARAWQRPGEGVVSIYARGRDYHKVLRQRLQKLAERMAAEAMGPLRYRVFTDSAPVLEVELAARSGQGWRGKHTLLLSREGGSMFFLGEIYVDLALPRTEPTGAHCGQLQRLHRRLPDGAIVAPYRLDARRCISLPDDRTPGADRRWRCAR
jgi:epoxyqueuosine reductase